MPKIWTPPPFNLAEAPLFTSSEIRRFEREILSNVRATERDASLLFRELPKFLYMGHGAEVRPEVVLYRPDGTPQRVDFFRRSYGKRFWDIIEIKHPNKPFTTSVRSSHPRISSYVEEAINQALDYREFVNEDSQSRARLLRRGIFVYRPQIVVIVGKHGHELDPEKLESLYDRIRNRGPIDAFSYEDIYEFALDHFRSNQVLVTLAASVFSAEPMPNPANKREFNSPEPSMNRASKQVKSSQKIFTDSEVTSLTGVCVEHLHNFATNRHLGFIARDPKGITPEQWLYTLSDLMVVVSLLPKCLHKPTPYHVRARQNKNQRAEIPVPEQPFASNPPLFWKRLWTGIPFFSHQSDSTITLFPSKLFP